MKKYLTARKDDSKAYTVDILSLNGSSVGSKTKGFLERNLDRLIRLSKFVWHELKKIGRGFVQMYQDVKYSVQTKTSKQKYVKHCYTKSVKLDQVKSDLLKFIPFSFFLIIPGLDLLLPVYIAIFPNSVPS